MATTVTSAVPSGAARGRWAGIRHAIKVNTSLRIDPEVFMLAKVAAELKGLSLNVYFERAIQEATARDVPVDHPARTEEA